MNKETDKTTGFVELLYSNSISFARDVFQYAIPGLLFLFLLSLPVLLEYDHRYLVLFHKGLKGILGWIAIVVVLLSYICGQIIYSLSHCVFELYKALHCHANEKEKLRQIRKNLHDILRSESPELETKYSKFKHCGSEKKDDEIHLFYEISTFATASEVHGKFIERYNILEHFRKSMSSVFLFNAILFYVSHLIYYCFHNDPSWTALIVFIVSLVVILSVLISLSLFFHGAYLRTKSAFYHRVFWSYFITKKRSTELIIR